jgi:hypothetical protein
MQSMLVTAAKYLIVHIFEAFVSNFELPDFDLGNSGRDTALPSSS